LPSRLTLTHLRELHFALQANKIKTHNPFLKINFKKKRAKSQNF